VRSVSGNEEEEEEEEATRARSPCSFHAINIPCAFADSHYSHHLFNTAFSYHSPGHCQRRNGPLFVLPQFGEEEKYLVIDVPSRVARGLANDICDFIEENVEIDWSLESLLRQTRPSLT